MTRLDDEYSPAEHHDLAEIDEHITEIHFPTEYGWVCACGERSGDRWPGPGYWTTKAAAVRAHDRHRERAT